MRFLFCWTGLWLIYWSATAQVLTDSLRIASHDRVFHYVVPPNPQPHPSLVFVLHGSGGTGLGMLAAANPSANRTETMQQRALAENTLVVYPDGYKRYWNECRKASPAEANRDDVDEQAFFKGMIRYFARRYGVDPARVFAVGTSGGGHMAYKLALTIPDAFRAVTAIIANLPDSTNMDCVPSGKPIPVLIINGTDDPVNPYQGGEVVTGGMRMGRVLSTDRTFGYWAHLAHYAGQPTRQPLPDTDPTDGRTLERYTYDAPGKPEIVLIKVVGGKHDYPRDLDVHQEALRFFQRQLTRPPHPLVRNDPNPHRLAQTPRPHTLRNLDAVDRFLQRLFFYAGHFYPFRPENRYVGHAQKAQE